MANYKRRAADEMGGWHTGRTDGWLSAIEPGRATRGVARTTQGGQNRPRNGAGRTVASVPSAATNGHSTNRGVRTAGLFARRLAASSDPAGRFFDVALVIDCSTAAGRGILAGIARFVRERGLWSIFHERRTAEDAAREFAEWSGDGIIAAIADREVAATLSAMRVPVVDVLGDLKDAGFPVVKSDDDAVAKMAADPRHDAVAVPSESSTVSTRRLRRSVRGLLYFVPTLGQHRGRENKANPPSGSWDCPSRWVFSQRTIRTGDAC